MKRTSRGSRAVRSAARSPARSMMGPGGGLDRDAQLGGDHVGEGRLAHARAGRRGGRGRGPRPRLRGRLDGDPQVGDHLGLADVLVERARAAATGRSRASSSLRPRPRRGAGSATGSPSATRDDLQRRGAGGPRSGRRRPRAARGRRPAPPRRASSRGWRGRTAGPPSGWPRRRRGGRLRPRRAAGILSFSSSTRRSAVFLPTPGMRVRRAMSLARRARRPAPAASMPGEDVDGQLGADARHLDEALEELLLVPR